jgi:hypothetical protein
MNKTEATTAARTRVCQTSASYDRKAHRSRLTHPPLEPKALGLLQCMARKRLYPGRGAHSAWRPEPQSFAAFFRQIPFQAASNHWISASPGLLCASAPLRDIPQTRSPFSPAEWNETDCRRQPAGRAPSDHVAFLETYHWAALVKFVKLDAPPIQPSVEMSEDKRCAN